MAEALCALRLTQATALTLPGDEPRCPASLNPFVHGTCSKTICRAVVQMFPPLSQSQDAGAVR